MHRGQPPHHATPDGWRIRRRSTTFMRKKGGYDSGRQHDPLSDPKSE
jgi:hypothetical protein